LSKMLASWFTAVTAALNLLQYYRSIEIKCPWLASARLPTWDILDDDVVENSGLSHCCRDQAVSTDNHWQLTDLCLSALFLLPGVDPGAEI